MKDLSHLVKSLIIIATLLGCSSQHPVKETFINNYGVRISYTDTGKGDTILLFVHGWCINKTYFNDQVSYFKNRYRVVTIDLGGYGKSGRNRNAWNTPTFATDVDAVIRGLKLKNVILIGHSMAGDIVLESAIHNPKQVIAIVGIDNFKNSGITNTDSVKSKKEYTEAIYQLKHNFKSIAYPYVTQQLLHKTTPAFVKKKVLYDLKSADTTIAAASMEQDNLDEAIELKKAGKPLFIISSDVNKTDTSGLHRLKIPVHLYYIHAVGHYPMIEKPAEFNKQLSDALTVLNRDKLLN